MKRLIIASDSKEELARRYNERQTSVGSPLKTLKGSTVKRSSKYGVGKEIGGKIYAHRDYIDEIVPEDILDASLDLLETAHDGFEWSCFRYDPVTHDILFQEAPDFDTAREPEVGYAILVNADKNIVGNARYYPQIWHHKWIWVRNDYSGFDVADSWEWSKEWLSTLEEPADGSNQANWISQLGKYGLS